MVRLLHPAAVLIGLFFLAMLPGCGGGVQKVKITGKLLKQGEALSLGRESNITVAFIPDTEAVTKQTYPARYQRATSSYEIDIPAGKYRINYIIFEKGKDTAQAPPELKAKSYDLTSDQQIDIDVQ